MALGYLGVNGVARKISKGYTGVDGVTRALKIGYVGVSGVARRFFTMVDKVLFNTSDSTSRRWYCAGQNGWGTAVCQTDSTTATWNKIDCSGYDYCTVRINGNVTSEPGGATVNNTFIKIGFTTDYNNAIEVVDKWNNSTGASGHSGLAYNKWYNLEIDVSALSGVQTLNVFVGGAHYNSGILYCSKITLHN